MNENTSNSLLKLAADWHNESEILHNSKTESLRLVGETYRRCSRELSDQVEACKKNAEGTSRSPTKSRSTKEEKGATALEQKFGEEDEIILTKDEYNKMFGKTTPSKRAKKKAEKQKEAEAKSEVDDALNEPKSSDET